MDKLPRGRKRDTGLSPAWMEEPKPKDPVVFSSMFTNIHGERWYARVDEAGHLRFWGDAIDCQYVYQGRLINYTAPILMGSDEQAWLGAMQEYARVVEFHQRKVRANG
jgi:hypothetical protein